MMYPASEKKKENDGLSGVPEYPALNPTLTLVRFIQGPPIPGTYRVNDLIDGATH